MKSKTEPASARIKRLLKVFCAYSFKPVTVCHFPSIMKVDKFEPHDIILISFDLHEALQEKILYSHQVWSTKSGNYCRKSTW